MRLNRRRFVTGMGTGAGIALAGCVGGPQDSGGDDTPTDDGNGDGGDDEESTPTATPMDPVNVGMVYATGGLGDGSFNDQAQTGIIQAEEELGIQYSEAQPSEVSEFANLQQQFASSEDPTYELVSCIGFLQTSALAQNAADYPDQNFMIVDSVPTTEDGEQFGNVASYVFAEQEGSYLVGQLAGLLTTQSFSAGAGSTQSDSTNVGFVGGVESPLIRRFEAGYIAGVQAANDDVDVQTSYVGDFNDPAGGREAALAMYNSGADIVYHAAGNTGTGVFQAAQDQSRFAIGVDSDQSLTRSSYADVIVASMVKRVDTAVFEGVSSVVNDEFAGGTTQALGLAEDGVGIVYGDQIGGDVPDDVVSQIEESRQAIVDGDVEVPTDPSNV
ncbi:BMP family protein [Salinirubellus salinus]|uniref:BMP family protein n=1 Tax=Salinirubellus salinus TaxID=1364945 RepID=A0A9E7U9X1_9EURY|nr:BMP family protein [Salinirubellus salinus]UWM56401.1 BMP family protein [Salinirubellus salinus]